MTEEEWVRREKDDKKLLLTREEWLKRSGKGGTEAFSGSKNRWRDSPRGVRDKSKVRCFKCSAYGHYAAECRNLKREKEIKEEANMAQIPDDEPALLLTECGEDKEAAMLVNEENLVPKLKESKQEMVSNLWYLDNGASNHMTGQRSKFSVLDENVTGRVKFGDGSVVLIKGKGSIVIKCKNGEERTLNEVYYIPSLCNNIISLGQMSEEGNKVILSGDFLWVRDIKGNLIMKVRRSENRLYKIILEHDDARSLLSKIEEDSWLWHSRCGHVNFRALKQMSTLNMAHGLPRLDQPKETCTGCLISKQTRNSFPSKSLFSSKEALELVHGDLCGPISPSTPGGCRYVFLLVDDWSRVMWTYLLKSKDEAFAAFKKFRTLVETKDRKIKTFRTDRGGEFMSKEFIMYCEEAGITRHFTAPYSPQQNGVVERRNRTMIEMARSFLKGMKMPNYFWGEAVRQSIYILNRLPTRAISGITPYEAWSGEKPHVEHIKVFGCMAHMRVPGTHMRKLDNRSRHVVYLGKEPGTKAFRLYDPEAKRVCVSRDVVFEEGKAWPWHLEEQKMNAEIETFTVTGYATEETREYPLEETDIAIPQGTSDTPRSPSDRYDMTGSSLSSHSATERSETETDSESQNFDRPRLNLRFPPNIKFDRPRLNLRFQIFFVGYNSTLEKNS